MAIVVTFPLVGTVNEIIDGCISGDDSDPVRPVDLDLGPVSWKMVGIDLDASTMTIEVVASETVTVNTGTEENPVWESRPATQEEIITILNYVQELASQPAETLLSMANAKPLNIKPGKLGKLGKEI